MLIGFQSTAALGMTRLPSCNSKKTKKEEEFELHKTSDRRETFGLVQRNQIGEFVATQMIIEISILTDHISAFHMSL